MLSKDVVSVIGQYLDVSDLKNCRLVSKLFNRGIIIELISRCTFTYKQIEKMVDNKVFLKSVRRVTNVDLEILEKLNQLRILNNIKHLTFGTSFNQKIENILPSSLTHLTFGKCFDQQIENILPSSLTHLKLSKNYPHKVEIPNLFIKYV